MLDGNGAGTASAVVDAIDWAVDHRKAYDIKVINLSLGAAVLQPAADDPLCEAAERAVAAGIVVVAASGNFGLTADGKKVMGGITSPGNSPAVITVGALDTKGTVARADDTVAKLQLARADALTITSSSRIWWRRAGTWCRPKHRGRCWRRSFRSGT